ncbi:hypothetical protein FOPE_09885 [Fonsecaea pedrosoi]|nr:hypothetical protein FOPE_09885 [Fonsecaea pedrosoi]
MYLGIVTTGYSGAFFTPTILKQLGWTSIRAQVMSIPIFVFATICALTCAVASDKLHHRFGFILGGCLIATIGYAILLNMHHVSVGVRYFALYAVIGGGYIAQPVTLVWVSNNVAGHYKRSAPEYPLGYGLGLGLIWLCVISSVIFLFYIRRENKLRDHGGRDDRYNLPEDEKNNLGDDHPAFRFTY